MVLSKEESKYILAQYAASDDVEFINFDISPLSADVLGFLGEHYRLEIVYRQREKYGKIHFFVKTLPTTSKKHTEYVQNAGFFDKEVLFYNNLIEEFQTYFAAAFAPIKYLAKPNDCIVLEDLTLRGYATHHQFDLEHCASVMQTLARFHSSSIIFERNHGCFINERYRDEMKEVTFVFDEGHPRKLWASNTLRSLIDCIKLIPTYSKNEIGIKLSKFVYDVLPGCLQPSRKFPNVVTHCDLWRNNMMFRRNASEELECILLDFQLVRYVPPAYDVMLTLYLNTNASFLTENLDELLRIYYENLCACLQTHGINPEGVLSKRLFLESVEFYKTAALVEAAFFGTIVFIDGSFSKAMLVNERLFENFTYFNRSKHVCKQFKENENYRNSMSNILHQLVGRFDEINL